MASQTFSERRQVIEKDRLWAIEKINKYSAKIKALNEEIFSLKHALKDCESVLEDCSQRDVVVDCDEFYEQHGVDPKEVIADFEKVVVQSTFERYEGNYHGSLEASSSVELLKLSPMRRYFPAYEKWQQCKMTPLEVEAAKCLKRFQHIDFSVNPWKKAYHRRR
jgi:hypothetical protein